MMMTVQQPSTTSGRGSSVVRRLRLSSLFVEVREVHVVSKVVVKFVVSSRRTTERNGTASGRGSSALRRLRLSSLFVEVP